MDPAPPTTPAPADLPSTGRPACRELTLGCALLALLVLVAYFPSLPGEFVWDDLLLVQQNPLVKGEMTLRSVWFSTDFPLSNVALWLEWLAFGKHALGYRLVNLALHAFSCMLLWRLLKKLQISGAWFAAALFAVHPVCVGSVAWISEIKNTLSLPFYLLSFWWFVQADETRLSPTPSTSRRSYLLSLLSFIIALLVKTSTVVLPAILFLWVWWKRQRITRQDCLRLAPHFALALAFGLATLWFHKHQTLGTFTMPPEDIATRLAGAGLAVWFYLYKALVPLGLSAVYPRWDIHPSNIAIYLPLATVIILAIVFWQLRRSWGRHALFAMGGFVASLFPVLGLFSMYYLVFSRVSDHFQYLALIVSMTALAAILCAKLPQKAFYAIRIILLVGLCALSMQRAHVWAKDESLWRDTLAKNPNAWNAHNNLGCILAEKNDIPGAAEEFLASLKANPRNPSALCNLGKVRLLQNNILEAEAHFRAALEIKPDHVDTLKAYSGALASEGRTAEAIKFLREALRLKPDDDARANLAALLSATGHDADAVTEFRQVLKTSPDSIEALNNLAWILATSSDDKVRSGTDAVKLATRANELTQQKQPQMMGTLAAAYAEAGDFTNAIATAEKTITLARAANNEGFARANEQLLRLYRAGKPYHSPPAAR